MPKIYRTMLADETGQMPKVGCDGGPGLGVRVPPDLNPDCFPDESGMVAPGSGGMSVAPSIDALLPHLIPVRLKASYSKAHGSNKKIIWSMGQGPFVNAPQGRHLTLQVTSCYHGLVETSAVTQLIHFQKALADTQENWLKDEE